MATVTLENLVKNYGQVQAVKGISLDIDDGEFVAFLGPSGCGKSSTMRMISGLEEATSGTISFDGRIVNQVRPRDRNVAMAFENYALYTTLSVYENLAFPLRAAKWAKDDLNRRVEEIADIMGITELLNRHTYELSSGQQQSVGLARALTRNPSVFLLDEPISHLDTLQRTHMRAYLKRLHLEIGHTMIYVTHDQEEAMALSDRIAVMSTGIINQVGTPSEIYNNPADMFVAGFIGEPPMNFLNCQYDQEKGVLRHGDITFDIPQKFQSLIQQDMMPQDVVLGIRPFYIDIGMKKSSRHTVPAQVYVVEPLGDMTVVSLDVADTRLQVVADSEFRAKPRQRLWLAFEQKHILLFDAKTEKALVTL